MKAQLSSAPRGSAPTPIRAWPTCSGSRSSVSSALRSSAFVLEEERARFRALVAEDSPVLGRGELSLIQGDGGRVPVLISLGKADLGGSVATCLVVTDIAQRKLTEQRLAEAEESLTITLHSIADAVIATDIAGRVTRMNRVAEAAHRRGPSRRPWGSRSTRSSAPSTRTTAPATTRPGVACAAGRSGGGLRRPDGAPGQGWHGASDRGQGRADSRRAWPSSRGGAGVSRPEHASDMPPRHSVRPKSGSAA